MGRGSCARSFARCAFTFARVAARWFLILLASGIADLFYT
jgi:hypothetical protein